MDDADELVEVEALDEEETSAELVVELEEDEEELDCDDPFELLTCLR